MSFQASVLPDGVVKVTSIKQMYSISPTLASKYIISESIGEPLSFPGNVYTVKNKTINVPLRIQISTPPFMHSLPSSLIINPRELGSFSLDLDINGVTDAQNRGSLTNVGVITIEVVPLVTNAPGFVLND
jgi:hypothetical protein